MTEPRSICSLRTASVFYKLYGGILGGGVLIGIVTVYRTGVWQPVVILTVLLGGYMLDLAFTKLIFSTDLISYRTLFTTKNITVADMIRAKFERGFIPFSYGPYMRIVITVRKAAQRNKIVLNAGLFDLAEVEQWIAKVNAHISNGKRIAARQ
jgi:hypothetical protein